MVPYSESQLSTWKLKSPAINKLPGIVTYFSKNVENSSKKIVVVRPFVVEGMGDKQ